MADSKPIPISRSTSPYRDLACFEEPLISFSVTPGASPPEAHDSHRNAPPRYEQLHPMQAVSRPRRNSTKKTDYEIALEMAREDSLMDIDASGAQHPLVQEQLLVANGRSVSYPIHSNHPGAGAERRSITDTSNLSNPGRSRPYNVQRQRSPIPFSRSRDEGSGKVAKVLCRGCQKEGSFFCNVCNMTLCNDCWNSQIPHRTGTRGPDNVPHEKTNYEVAQKIQAVLDPSITDEQRKVLHKKDENTTWFGVAKDELDELIFQDCGKYASLMADCSSNRKRRQYPGLVSFVGQTGAGKSTLIKMLIDLRSNVGQEAVPVVGSVNHSVPTSGDVHLYVDPCTHFTDYPILYADCEGLDGGAQEPMALQARRTENSNRIAQPGKRTPSFQKRLRKKHHSSQREITWADTVEKRSRQFVVKNLYPRLLYTFSDVVVFVLRNPRVIENAVEQLIMWASAAVEKSTNQPVQPHLIIALNATENSIDPEQWDVEVATRRLMQSITEAIFTNPKFIEYVRERKQVIRNAQDLLCSYYSSVRVVRIPTKGRPKLISDQLGKLYQEIHKGCMESQGSKRRVRMLLDSDELQPYLQYAFDHFSNHLETPFDFVKASFLNNPIPRDFSGNILKMALNVMNVWKDKLDGFGIFKELSPLVASCIMLDSTRHKTKGSAESIFREDYIIHCDDAIEDFCNRYWPCEYSSTAGRCVNVRSGHSQKGHQLESGRTFGSGPYMSKFSAEDFTNKWRNMIHHDLELLLQRLREASSDNEYQELTAANIHRTAVLDPFYRHVGFSDRYISHSTCLACLIASPQHALPCGHVLCTACLQAFGSSRKKNLVELNTCPLLHEEQLLWTKPWQIAFKPASAGVRVLTLDGGGIRGIVELEILRLIQKALGANIPIQDFFDLIVGTSTGGIIALGLGVEAWPVDECTSHFTSLCEQAFTHRKGHSIPGLAQMVVAHHGSIYETRPLQNALMTAFSDNYLFGGPRDSDTPQIKVAVTAASAAGLQPVVLSNYNRLSGHEEQRSYRFQRPEEPEHELKIWEAARATSAAPTYYKQFSHESSGQVFIDGGIWHNNPVVVADCERKIMWPDVAHLPPDMLLSIGSGFCGKYKSLRRPLRTARRTGIGSNVKAFYRIAVDHIESSLDSEKAWRDYIALVSPEKDQCWRYRRLNLELDEAPPKLDEVECLSELQVGARRRWASDEEIKSIAQCLVASSFFFEFDKTRLETLEDESIKCTGIIHCRFVQGSQQIRELGAYLQRCQVGNHSSYFVVQEKYREGFAHQIPIPKDKIKNMTQYGSFTMELEFTTSGQHFPTDMLLCLDNSETYYSISGFPRLLQDEDGPGVVRRAGGKPNRWRTPSQLHRRGKWAGPNSSELRERDNDTISNYSNPDYIIGNSTPAALDNLSARFQQLTLEFVSSSRVELDAGGPAPRYELADTSQGIAELPTRTWPDHLTKHAEHDESYSDPDGELKGYEGGEIQFF